MPLVLAALAVLLLVAARLVLSPGLLASPGGEVYGHAWVQWWHSEALPGWPAGTELVEGASSWPVIDPLPTAFAAGLWRLFGPLVGYNAWILLAVAMAFAGGAFLAKQEDGDPLTGGLTLALWPALLGSLMSGLTEDGGIGLIAAGLALIGRDRPWAGVLAGLALGLAAWCGLVIAWVAAVVAVGLTLASDRRTWPGLLLGGLLAGLIVFPLAMTHADRLGGAGHHAGSVIARGEPLWRLNPWHGVDLLSLIAPGRQDPGDALVRIHPGYLGIVPLLLAIRGGWSRWWVVLIGCALLALGPGISIAGEPTGIDNPIAALAHLLPLGELLNHHGRALLIGGVAMAALTARGVARLPAKYRLPAALLLAADLALLSPAPVPLPVTPLRAPDAAHMLADLPDGEVLVVPAAGPGIHFQRPLLDQRVHRRPLRLSPNRPGDPIETDAGMWLAGLAFPQPPPVPTEIDLPPMIVLAMPGYADAVTAGLGTPDVLGADGSAAWVVP
ncbi:MAG: hypothetical protein ACI8RZ_004672 [Myxococcota bacterium]|jgi:hypothetical protein